MGILKTLGNIRFICWIFFIMLGVRLNSEERKPPEYLKYVDEIVDTFADEMEQSYGLFCNGSGGSMPKDVAEVEVSFISYKMADVAEVREIEVKAVEKLLYLINSHEKIRPFLREYPFKSDRVDVSISFRNEEDERPCDGSVAYVFLARNRIFYRSAEIRTELTPPMSDCRDFNNIITYPQEEIVVEALVPLHEETYEKAVKIVKEKVDDK